MINSETCRYRVYVEPLAEHLGGEFVAYAPDLKGCVADGETPDEALHEIYDAIAGWIDDARRSGEALPAPMPMRAFA